MEVRNDNDTRVQTRSALVPYLLICVAPVVWGMSGVLVRWSGLPGKEYIIIFWRSAFALAFFALAILVMRDARLFRPGARPFLLAASGLVTALYTPISFICGLQQRDITMNRSFPARPTEFCGTLDDRHLRVTSGPRVFPSSGNSHPAFKSALLSIPVFHKLKAGALAHAFPSTCILDSIDRNSFSGTATSAI